MLPFPEKIQIAGITTADDISGVRDILDTFFVKIFGFIPNISQGVTLAKFLHPGVAGTYSHDGVTLAKFGRIHPEVTENFEIPENTIYFEMNFEEIFALLEKTNRRFENISVYQPISRELNFILPKNVEIGEIAHKIEAVHPWIGRVIVDSIFEDAEKIGENLRSVNFSFIVQSPTGTISDEEAKNIQNSVIETIGNAGYKLRGM